MMASQHIPEPGRPKVEISEDLKSFLDLRETETHYAIRTSSGATLLRPKSEIFYSWQLLSGVLDTGADLTEERKKEREWELAHDRRKFGLDDQA